tara:strand:+ start:95 stop:466 length:372 start_codon:yes stop_codon:yes gene_type:complete
VSPNNQTISIEYPRIIIPHGVVTVCVILLSFATPILQNIRWELIIGSSMSLLNFSLAGWCLKNIFIKKRVALSLGVIVFKWPILGLILYQLVIHMGFNPLGLIAGVATLIPGVVGIFLLKRPQ